MNGIKQVGIVLVAVQLPSLLLFEIVKLILVGTYMAWVAGAGFVSSGKAVDLHESFLLTFLAPMILLKVLLGVNSSVIFVIRVFLVIPVICLLIIF